VSTSNDITTSNTGDVAKISAGDARALIAPHTTAIVEKLVALAKAGDPKSIQLALAYGFGQPERGQNERVNIPGFAQAKTLQEKAEAVIAAVASGDCTAEAAERLLRVIDIYSKSVVADEMERRIAALEAGRTAPAARVDRVDDFSELA
jgi:hypothetical protein